MRLVSCVVGGFAAVVFLGCGRSVAVSKDDAGAVAVVVTPSATPPPRTLQDNVLDAPSLSVAFSLAKPEMEDTSNKIDDGTYFLALWAAKTMRWSDVAVTTNETTFALAQKDSDEARGKRLCVSGAIVQIELAKLKTGKLFDGLLHDYSNNLYKFAAAGTSGDLVERSAARFCGVITGKFEYTNSGGGTGHAIKMVGMFDLPANRATGAVPAAAVAVPAGRPATKTAAPADEPPPAIAAPPRAPDPCDPPYTFDETGAKHYKKECLK